MPLFERRNPLAKKLEAEGWHRADVVAAVRKRGSSLAEIARSIGLKRQSMYWALISPHVRANRAIADFLGVPLNELWPQWFDADDNLISTRMLPRPAVKHISAMTYESRPRKRAA